MAPQSKLGVLGGLATAAVMQKLSHETAYPARSGNSNQPAAEPPARRPDHDHMPRDRNQHPDREERLRRHRTGQQQDHTTEEAGEQLRGGEDAAA